MEIVLLDLSVLAGRRSASIHDFTMGYGLDTPTSNKKLIGYKKIWK